MAPSVRFPRGPARARRAAPEDGGPDAISTISMRGARMVIVHRVRREPFVHEGQAEELRVTEVLVGHLPDEPGMADARATAEAVGRRPEGATYDELRAMPGGGEVERSLRLWVRLPRVPLPRAGQPPSAELLTAVVQADYWDNHEVLDVRVTAAMRAWREQGGSSACAWSLYESAEDRAGRAGREGRARSAPTAPAEGELEAVGEGAWIVLHKVDRFSVGRVVSVSLVELPECLLTGKRREVLKEVSALGTMDVDFVTCWVEAMDDLGLDVNPAVKDLLVLLDAPDLDGAPLDTQGLAQCLGEPEHVVRADHGAWHEVFRIEHASLPTTEWVYVSAVCEDLLVVQESVRGAASARFTEAVSRGAELYAFTLVYRGEGLDYAMEGLTLPVAPPLSEPIRAPFRGHGIPI